MKSTPRTTLRGAQALPVGPLTAAATHGTDSDTVQGSVRGFLNAAAGPPLSSGASKSVPPGQGPPPTSQGGRPPSAQTTPVSKSTIAMDTSTTHAAAMYTPKSSAGTTPAMQERQRPTTPAHVYSDSSATPPALAASKSKANGKVRHVTAPAPLSWLEWCLVCANTFLTVAIFVTIVAIVAYAYMQHMHLDWPTVIQEKLDLVFKSEL